LSDTAIFEPLLVDLFLGPDEWLGYLVVAAMKASMCSGDCSTTVKEAPLSDWPCRIENHVST